MKTEREEIKEIIEELKEKKFKLNGQLYFTECLLSSDTYTECKELSERKRITIEKLKRINYRINMFKFLIKKK